MAIIRQEFVLAALAAESGATFAPVQVQKLFFLFDQNIAEELGGKQFAFEPYDYGPFDKAVYRELEDLARLDLVRIESAPIRGRRAYGLTLAGQQRGDEVLERLSPVVRDYLRQVSRFVRSLSFAELVGTIYRAYPSMRENSVFVGD